MNTPVGTSGRSDRTTLAARLGFVQGQIVQELGWEEDVDNAVRFAIEDVVGSELEDEDYSGAADGVLLWWRDGDGDLADGLVDAVTNLDESGFICLLTPRPGSPDAVPVSDVDEAAKTAGLSACCAMAAGEDWAAMRLVAPKHGRR